jgi:hypothetical protein
MKVKSALKAGKIAMNTSQTVVGKRKVRAGVKKSRKVAGR